MLQTERDQEPDHQDETVHGHHDLRRGLCRLRVLHLRNESGLRHRERPLRLLPDHPHDPGDKLRHHHLRKQKIFGGHEDWRSGRRIDLTTLIFKALAMPARARN